MTARRGLARLFRRRPAGPQSRAEVVTAATDTPYARRWRHPARHRLSPGRATVAEITKRLGAERYLAYCADQPRKVTGPVEWDPESFAIWLPPAERRPYDFALDRAETINLPVVA